MFEPVESGVYACIIRKTVPHACWATGDCMPGSPITYRVMGLVHVYTHTYCTLVRLSVTVCVCLVSNILGTTVAPSAAAQLEETEV